MVGYAREAGLSGVLLLDGFAGEVVKALGVGDVVGEAFEAMGEDVAGEFFGVGLGEPGIERWGGGELVELAGEV